jgi:hypothetical protein
VKSKINFLLCGGVLFAGGLRAADDSVAWHPAPGTLMTRWAAEVSPANVHPEYPRPQLVRADWLNLNGLWNYAVTPSSVSKVTNFDGQILVPFPHRVCAVGRETAVR